MASIIKNRRLVIGGIAAAAVAVTIIGIQAVNLQRPAEILEQEPSRQQAPLSIIETVTITIPQGATNRAQDEGFAEEHYVPGLATVSTGSQVTWLNADTVSHTATAGTPADGPSGQFDTGIISPGESRSVMVRAEGGQSILYYCTVHPWLTGELQMTL